ncbi:aminotransferase class V-fold PLP-dependent enzyme [Candidatus Woesearchaeota archaeon]|nr:aminotransferase class V-fold PLP-dependent enzyme [Candidatus Woesearchaeota archaeon]
MNKEDFPFFKRRINNREIIYLNSASTSQKPFHVIDAINDFYETYNFSYSENENNEVNEIYEANRRKIASFVKAEQEEIIFTKGTTESINFLASSLDIKKGDEVLVSELEHDSNVLPWQQICKVKGAKLKFIKVNNEGELDDIGKYLTKKTKVVSLSHVSNFLGTTFNISEIGKKIHENNSLFVVDGNQSVPSIKYNVKESNIDFLAFSGHKMLGPSGIGVLYGKKELLENLKPYQYGSFMSQKIETNTSELKKTPFKFEAGTPNVEGVIGLGAAVNYLNKIGMENIEYNNRKLVNLFLEKTDGIKNLHVYGKNQENLVSFNFDLLSAGNVSAILNRENIFINSGNHNVSLFHKKLKIDESARISFYLYNNEEDVNALVYVLEKIGKSFAKK